MHSRNQEKLLPVHVAAQRLGKAPRTVRHLIEGGRLPAKRIGKRAWGITPYDLEEYRVRDYRRMDLWRC